MRSPLSSKLLITFGVLFYVLVIPYLEWNHTHVFNPDWPPHARFHEVWQLFTHIALGVVALWLVWRHGLINLPAIISSCVMGGVVFSHTLSSHVGGSVQSGNLSRHILGLELAVFVAVAVIVMSVLALVLARKSNLHATV